MVKFTSIEGTTYKYNYPAVFRRLARGKDEGKKRATYRKLAAEDLFFLLFWGLQREDVNRAFIVAAIRELEEGPATDTLDLWAREHYKSTIITFGETIQDIIRNPEERIGIFSHTRPIAKGFLRQIKQTFEGDPPVKKWFPEIFWSKPKTQAPKWSEDDGLIFKRKSTAKEATVEAWGLVDGHPTSKHFTKLVYDDVVTKDSVTTPEQIKKTMNAYELSLSLGADGGRKRMLGTHYHFADLYMAERKKGALKPRIKAATDDGKATGRPVLLSPARLAELLRNQGPYIFACQQLLNPVGAGEQKFKSEWIKRFSNPPRLMNVYLTCDPANEKKADSDFTVFTVVGIDSEKNRYWLDGSRKKLNLGERWDELKRFYLKYRPIRTGYEKYGKDSDIQYYEEKMRSERVYFPITALGGQIGKFDRIERLVPHFASGNFWLPSVIPYEDPITGKRENLVQVFIDEELIVFPYSIHDDILDCLSRTEDEDMRLTAPLPSAGMSQRDAETEYNILH